MKDNDRLADCGKAKTVARRVYYSGHVQGVGFRYTVCGLAEGRPVHGYVRNLPDGRVELWAEATEDALAEFLAAVARRMARGIADQVMEDCRPQEMTGFKIRY